MNTNRQSCHHGKQLVWAAVECGCREFVEKQLFNFIVVFFNELKWENCCTAWWRLLSWAVA